jgi:hypothetical protein
MGEPLRGRLSVGYSRLYGREVSLERAGLAGPSSVRFSPSTSPSTSTRALARPSLRTGTTSLSTSRSWYGWILGYRGTWSRPRSNDRDSGPLRDDECGDYGFKGRDSRPGHVWGLLWWSSSVPEYAQILAVEAGCLECDPGEYVVDRGQAFQWLEHWATEELGLGLDHLIEAQDLCCSRVSSGLLAFEAVHLDSVIPGWDESSCGYLLCRQALRSLSSLACRYGR